MSAFRSAYTSALRDLEAAEARCEQLETVRVAAEEVAATHHGHWPMRVVTNGHEHIPKIKLVKLRAALAALSLHTEDKA
jgi:hypothetical protein